MSNSVWPHRRQPIRLPCPWDSPGKNTGVGCHFLLQCVKVKVKSLSRVRLLVTPWTAAYQAPPSMGFSRQEYWSGVPLPSPSGPWGNPKQNIHPCLKYQLLDYFMQLPHDGQTFSLYEYNWGLTKVFSVSDPSLKEN